MGRLRGLKRFGKGLSRSRAGTYAAAAAFFLFVALVPLAIVISLLLPFTPVTADDLLKTLALYVPDSLTLLLEGIVADVYAGGHGRAFVFSLIAAVWSASRVVAAVSKGLEAIHDSTKLEGYVRRRWRSGLYTVVLLIVLLLCFLVTLLGNSFREQLAVRWPELLAPGQSVLRLLLAFVLLTLFFALLYRRLPHGAPPYLRQLPGAAAAAVAWLLASWLFSVYLALTGTHGAYGRLGVIVIALLWMYACMLLLLVGAYLSRWLVREGGRARRRGPLRRIFQKNG